MFTIPEVADLQFGAFTLRQAAASGCNERDLQRAASRGDVMRLRRGVYAAPIAAADRYSQAVAELAAHGAAVALTVPSALVTSATATAMWGAPVIDCPATPCVTVPPGFGDRLPDVHVHRAHVRPSDRTRIGAIPVATYAGSVVDLGRERGPEHALAAADHALHTGRLTTSALRAAVNQQWGMPGIVTTREALALADARTESVLESVSRWRMHQEGLPPPEPQARIYTRSGLFIGRVDFLWEQFGVVGEADGRAKYGDDVDTVLAQASRQALLEELGLIVVRWSWKDRDDFAQVANRLRLAFERSKWRPIGDRNWVVRRSA